ncbi:GroES-like protein [Xylariaceae sp. FL0016]|nr:GroES-like protein [Xylariaceae sp. FL0016]
MMAALPQTMKAWVAARPGKPRDVLELKTDWPLPASPKAGEIMVKVSYVALNPGDLKMMPMKMPFRRNTIPGMDFVGQVVQVGPSSYTSPPLELGTTVAGTMSMKNIWLGVGVLAEYAVVPARVVVKKPADLDETVAAGLLGVVGQTSATLLQTAGLRAGTRALVNGASGGVGSILIQVLQAKGVHVTGICSARNAAFIKHLGADEVRLCTRK